MVRIILFVNRNMALANHIMTMEKDFVSGAISLRQLEYAMKLGHLGEQIVLKSPNAFDQIRFCDCQMVDCKEWYPKRRHRDDEARKAYYDLDKNQYIRGDLYITRILDEEMKADDPRLS